MASVTIHQIGPIDTAIYVFDEDLNGRNPTATSIIHVPEHPTGTTITQVHGTQYPRGHHVVRISDKEYAAYALVLLAESKKHRDVYLVAIIV